MEEERKELLSFLLFQNQTSSLKQLREAARRSEKFNLVPSLLLTYTLSANSLLLTWKGSRYESREVQFTDTRFFNIPGTFLMLYLKAFDAENDQVEVMNLESGVTYRFGKLPYAGNQPPVFLFRGEGKVHVVIDTQEDPAIYEVDYVNREAYLLQTLIGESYRSPFRHTDTSFVSSWLYSSKEDKTVVEWLEFNGSDYDKWDQDWDGNIITMQPLKGGFLTTNEKGEKFVFKGDDFEELRSSKIKATTIPLSASRVVGVVGEEKRVSRAVEEGWREETKLGKVDVFSDFTGRYLLTKVFNLTPTLYRLTLEGYIPFTEAGLKEEDPDEIVLLPPTPEQVKRRLKDLSVIRLPSSLLELILPFCEV